MRFRRVVEHLKSQHWTAVAIDFVIVVIGVFVAMQVSNWNEDRHLERRKAAAIERMHRESEAAIAYLQERVDFFAREAADRTEVLTRLQSGDWKGADTERMTAALDSLGFAPALSPPRGVYDELISTGMFAELGDANLRDAISNYYAYLDFVHKQLDYFRSSMLAHTKSSFSPGEAMRFVPDAERQAQSVYDFPLLSADRDFVYTAIMNSSSQSAQSNWARKSLERAKAVCAELARIDGRACKSSSPP